jgi:hypothetical protein
MHVELHKRTITDARESVHFTGLDDEDVTSSGLELLTVHHPPSLPFLDELNLVVRVDVWLRPGSRQAVKEKNGNVHLTLVGAHEMVRASAKRQVRAMNTKHDAFS